MLYNGGGEGEGRGYYDMRGEAPEKVSFSNVGMVCAVGAFILSTTTLYSAPSASESSWAGLHFSRPDVRNITLLSIVTHTEAGPDHTYPGQQYYIITISCYIIVAHTEECSLAIQRYPDAAREEKR